jgi:hypothetical protein
LNSLRDSAQGEEAALLQELIASACREVEAVGEGTCRAAITLIEEVVDRIADDARAAAELAGAAHHRPC